MFAAGARRVWPALLFLPLLLPVLPGRLPGAPPAGEARLHRALAGLVTNGGVAVGGAPGAAPAFVYGEGVYTPASIIKLATALAAFRQLGPDYRFRTEVYRSGQGNLFVKGYGDPFLISEEWHLIAAELAAKGIWRRPLRNLFLDRSAFHGDLRVDGAADSTNPYDARLGALISNFNTIFVHVAPGGVVTSAEAQTPLTPSAVEMAESLPAGRHRINFSRRPGAGLRYSGELALEIFRLAGARFEGNVRGRRVPAGLEPVLVHRSSRPLTAVVRGMLEFSNNFVANQIILVLALEKHGTPARFSDGVALVAEYVRSLLPPAEGQLRLVEGSGLSRKNRIGLSAMLRVVEAFRPWQGLLKPYGRQPWIAPAKTGTLGGVYTLAGFLPGRPGARRAFVIMLNQPRNTRRAVFLRIATSFAHR